MQIEITQEATEDVRNIELYLSEYPKVFSKLILRFNNAIKIIKNNPLIGKVGRVEETRELFITKTNYFIVYRINNNLDRIEILTILHTSRMY